MAAVNNEIDILQDISPESWDILKEKNPNAKCWTEEFPYAIPDDPVSAASPLTVPMNTTITGMCAGH